MTETLEPLDPELIVPDGVKVPFDLSDVDVARQSHRETREGLLRAGFATVPDPGIEVRATSVGAVPVRIFRSHEVVEPVGIFLHLHGGAFVLGDVGQETTWCEDLARAGLLVVSVDYRLAPEEPYPAALNDAIAALRNLPAVRETYRVSGPSVIVGGQSAGGNLAAALCLRSRDEGGPDISLQVLNQPCVDDLLATPSVNRPEFEATRRDLARMWKHYLGESPGDYLSAPLRASDLTGLPRALVIVAELDPIHDEGVEYARRLASAGVEVRLERFARANHGFDEIVPKSRAAVHLRRVTVEESLTAIGLPSKEAARVR